MHIRASVTFSAQLFKVQKPCIIILSVHQSSRSGPTIRQNEAAAGEAAIPHNYFPWAIFIFLMVPFQSDSLCVMEWRPPTYPLLTQENVLSQSWHWVIVLHWFEYTRRCWDFIPALPHYLASRRSKPNNSLARSLLRPIWSSIWYPAAATQVSLAA